jgi:hypothetical protein
MAATASYGPADAAVGADHGVLVEPADACVHAFPPEHPGQLPGHHQLGHRPRDTNRAMTPARMSELVKACPLASSGWTSPKPTVARVMTVM